MAKSNSQINKENDATDNSLDSPAVIAYRLAQVENAVKEGFISHNEKLDKIANNFTTKEVTQEINKRVISLESDRVWIVRLIVGAVVMAVLALIGVGLKLKP